MDRRLVLTMAAAAGVAVANLYYIQPLLPAIAAGWGTAPGAISSAVVAAQVGYALGLLLIVPLGDRLERRALIVSMVLATAVALLAAAAARGPVWLTVAHLLIGFATVAPQLIVPFAAHLAPPQERGRVVGAVMSGLFVGILLARTVSGAIGAALGWRAVYVAGAAVMLVLGLVLRRALPYSEPEASALGYGQLLRSLADLLRDEPVLRTSSTLGAAAFAGFSAFWTVLPFLLAGPAYRYGTGVIGLFGLVGVTGITVAPIAGRLSDSGRGRVAIGTGLSAMLASYVWLWADPSHLWSLIPAIVLLDLGSALNHISNQARVYSVRPAARSRMNTVYMTIYFAGGAIGSSLGAWGWARDGWPGFCLAGGSILTAGLLAFALFRWPPARSR